MTRHYNTKHPERTEGGYRGRLTARGLSKTPHMEDAETLAKRQNRRIVETCTLPASADGQHNHVCNGQPYYTGATGE